MSSSNNKDKLPTEADPLIQVESQATTTDDGDGDPTVLETLVENVAEECQEITDAFMEELQEADDGDKYFLDMGITRNLSFLPSEMTNAAELLKEDVSQSKLQDDEMAHMADYVASGTSKPVAAYIGLAVAVTSLSSLGPFLGLQQGTSGTMKITWRMTSTAMLLTPFAYLEYKKDGLPNLNYSQWFNFVLSTFCYVTMGVGFVLALNYTSVGNAVILANSQAVMLLAGNLFVGAPVTLLEGLGAIIAFTGAVLCSKDASAGPSDGASMLHLTVFGDFLATIAGLGGVGYLVFAKVTRPHIGLFIFTFMTMTLGATFCIFFQIYGLEEDVTFDRDARTGVFGFTALQMDRLPLEMATAIVCNMLGTMGYVNAMRHFDSLIISVAGLMEPVMAELLSFGFGVGALPGLLGWIGNLLVIVGTTAVVWPTPNGKRNSSSVDGVH